MDGFVSAITRVVSTKDEWAMGQQGTLIAPGRLPFTGSTSRRT